MYAVGSLEGGTFGLLTQHLALPGTTADVSVVHGVPGLTVDVYVNGKLTLPGFKPGTITDPLALPAGTVIADIEGFELAWAVRAGEHRIDFTTPFRREARLPAGAKCYLHPVMTTNQLPALPVSGTLVYNPLDLNWYVCLARPGRRTFGSPRRAPAP